MTSAWRALDVPRRDLMGSGPCNVEGRVLRAMALPPVPSDDPLFSQILDDVSAAARAVFQTANACTLAVPGASRAGIEAVLASLIEPGDRVLVGVYGHFGELLCTLAAKHGASVERVDAAWGSPIEPGDFARAVRRLQPRLTAVVHADTSTGILQPLQHIGEACRDVDSLFVVDAVLSLGGAELAVDAWAIDAAIGGLQKCLGGPPGLALVTCSDRARQVRAARRTQPDSTYLDLALLEAHWLSRLGLESAEADFPTPMLYAAREALRMVLEEGLTRRWQRHQHASAVLRAGLEAMGLHIFSDPDARVPMISLVCVPDGVDEPGVRAQLLVQHGIEIMAAFGPLRGKVWRIGTMGTNASLPSVLATLAGLEAVLAQSGFNLTRGAAIDAAMAHSRQAGGGAGE